MSFIDYESSGEQLNSQVNLPSSSASFDGYSESEKQMYGRSNTFNKRLTTVVRGSGNTRQLDLSEMDYYKSRL
jgi:hypothetical protein